MDIIKLYNSKKPYRPHQQSLIDDNYVELTQSRLPTLVIGSSLALLFAITSKNRKMGEIAIKSSLLVAGTVLINEAYQWNQMLAKIYLIQKSTENI